MCVAVDMIVILVVAWGGLLLPDAKKEMHLPCQMPSEFFAMSGSSFWKRTCAFFGGVIADGDRRGSHHSGEVEKR